MKELLAIGQKYNIQPLRMAEAIGSEWRVNLLVQLVFLALFPFMGLNNKFEGGMFVTQDELLYKGS